MSSTLLAAGSLAAFFALTGAASGAHPFPALNNTGTDDTTAFRVPLVAAYKPCRDEGGNPDSIHDGMPGNSCGHTGAAGLTSQVVKPGGMQRAWVRLRLKNPNAGGQDIVVAANLGDVRCKVANAGAGCPAVNADYNPNAASGPYTTPPLNDHTTFPAPPCTHASSCFTGRDMSLTFELPNTQYTGAGAGMPVDQSPPLREEARTVAERALRLTDHFNARKAGAPCNQQGAPPPSCLGTSQDMPITFPLVCTVAGSQTAAPGSSCGVNTTFNALVPGSIVRGKRTSMEVGTVNVYDAGLNGEANFLVFPGDDRLAWRQGITAP